MMVIVEEQKCHAAKGWKSNPCRPILCVSIALVFRYQITKQIIVLMEILK